MEQKLLHKMFNGEATDNELTQIRQWVNADKMNRETFYHERALFDALQLNAFQKGNHVRKQSVPLWKWIGSAAAAVIALFLLYNIPVFTTKNIQPEIALNTIKVPAGQRVEVTLSDGTHIWLNARSEFSYPASFNENTREVRLKGEAFFDVAKDRNKKFIVNTGRCEVEVLGTQFNVEAYDDRESVKTTLVEGSVDVQAGGEKVRLIPHEQLQYHKNTAEMEVREVNVREIIAWKNGWFVFDNTTLGEIVKTLQRWYNIEVEFIRPELEHLRFTGDLSRYDSFDAVIRMFEDTKKLNMSVISNRLIVDRK